MPILPGVHFVFAYAIGNWLHRLGALGLILMGIADNSVIPLPGSMDVLTIWLAANHRQWWFLFAFVATVGAMLGGYITYSLAAKRGKEAIENRLGKRRAARVFRRFERWGFGAIAIPAVLPPPFPMVPFLLAAGALQVSRKKFLGALALGRGIRFSILAGLGAFYGNWVVGFFAQYYKPAILVLVGLAAVGCAVALIQYRRLRPGDRLL